jgi:hypothetical protein
VIKRLDLLIKLVKSGDVVVNCLLWLVFQRNQLLEGVALTQHRNVSKIKFEDAPDIAGRFAVPNQLKFGFEYGGNKDTHGVAVVNFPCGKSFWFVIVVRWIGFAGDDVIQMFPEFDLAFEAPLFVSSTGEGIHNSVQCGIGRHGENKGEDSSEEKIASLLSGRVGLYPKYWYV